MTPSVFFALLLACALPFNSAQSSCNGQCGGEYNRGYMCQCDYDCLTHEECCIDYESQCTTSDSCKGRCGESFKRGRLCDCDPDCARFKKCCPDYDSQCGIEEPEPEPPQIQPTEEPDMTPNPQEELSEDLSDDQPMPLFTPEPEIQYEQEDDVKGETWPDLPLPSPDTGSEDPEASPYPEDPEAGLVDPEATANPDDPEETPASENTGGSEFSPTEPASSDPLDPTLNTNLQPTDTEDDPEKEAILKGDYTPFPEELDTEATPGSEGTPPAANPNPSTAEPANETPAEATDSSDPEGQPYSSSSPSAADPTLPMSTSEPTPASPVAPQSSDQASPSSEPQPGPTPAEDTPELLPEGQSELDPEGQEAESKNTVPDESEPTPSNLQDPNVASETPASESGPESKPGRGATPNNLNDNSVPQTGDLATRLTIDPAGQEEGDEAAPEETTSNSMKLSPAPAPTPVPVPVPVPTTKPTQNKLTEKIKPSKPTEKPKPKSTQPNTLTDINQALGTENSRDYQADEHNDTNICSGRPVGAVTTLRNGTVVVFRGHYFWVMDSNRMAGPAHRITDVWGVPSPIDTVFTRCNCQGKTYFFKGANYWRFENSMMDMGFPKLISVGFNGLRGQITAALSVPEYRKRKESVYFFKGGGLVQKYSYQSGTSPTCNRKAHNSVYTVHNRVARQAVSLLGQEINIRLTWRGFPSTVTSAVSIPTHRKPEGYNYYLLSRSKYYNVNMRDERPFIATPPVSATPQKNSAKDFLNCPKEV